MPPASSGSALSCDSTDQLILDAGSTEVAHGLGDRHGAVVVGDVVDPGAMAYREPRRMRCRLDMDRWRLGRRGIPGVRPVEIAVAQHDAGDAGCSQNFALKRRNALHR